MSRPFFIFSLLAAAGFVTARHGSRNRDGPLDPGIASDCTWFDIAYVESYTCDYFVEYWELTLADFLDWV
jgi:hypothetical protein